MMGTRSGSLDPSVILRIAELDSLSLDEVNKILNKQSGLLGVSGVGSDDREILKAENNGNELAKLSHEMMVYQIEILGLMCRIDYLLLLYSAIYR